MTGETHTHNCWSVMCWQQQQDNESCYFSVAIEEICCWSHLANSLYWLQYYMPLEDDIQLATGVCNLVEDSAPLTWPNQFWKSCQERGSQKGLRNCVKTTSSKQITLCTVMKVKMKIDHPTMQVALQDFRYVVTLILPTGVLLNLDRATSSKSCVVQDAYFTIRCILFLYLYSYFS